MFLGRLFLISVLILNILHAKPLIASSQEACAIWLCLPAGFPSGCSGAYSEFLHRIKHRKPPLPSLTSCTGGSDTGDYQLGREEYYPCEEGYSLVLPRDRNLFYYRAKCYKTSCAPKYSKEETEHYCNSYQAKRRAKSQYIHLWVNEDDLGWFYY